MELMIVILWCVFVPLGFFFALSCTLILWAVVERFDAIKKGSCDE